MKLCVIGGGGVRSPFLAKSIASNAHLANITHVVFMDTNENNLNKYGKIAKGVSNRTNPRIKFELTTDPTEAIKDADYVITTIRVGEDLARVNDEHIVKEYGLLAQETTGACGFAFAMRSIPVLIEYCKLIEQYANKDCKVFNFTNPSGLVTQALYYAGYSVYGICDAPSEFIKQIVDMLDIEDDELSCSCFGLNHLSWFGDFKINKLSVDEMILKNPKLFKDTEMRLFDKGVIDIYDGWLPNEYLYFYLYTKKAISLTYGADKTRAELIHWVNEKMSNELDTVDIDNNYDEAFKIFFDNYNIRENNYMVVESGVKRVLDYKTPTVDEYVSIPDRGGYAGVALKSVRAMETGEPVEMILSIPNNGVVNFLKDDDIIEVSCIVDKDGAIAKKPSELPEYVKAMIILIKEYERVAARAIINKDRSLAIKALVVNPFVGDYDIASKLVDQFIAANGDNTWK